MPHTHTMHMSNNVARDVLWLGHTKKKKKKKKKKNTKEAEKSVKSEQSENAARLVVVSVAFEKSKNGSNKPPVPHQQINA